MQNVPSPKRSSEMSLFWWHDASDAAMAAAANETRTSGLMASSVRQHAEGASQLDDSFSATHQACSAAPGFGYWESPSSKTQRPFTHAAANSPETSVHGKST
jgi:hypothetical protein